MSFFNNNFIIVIEVKKILQHILVTLNLQWAMLLAIIFNIVSLIAIVHLQKRKKASLHPALDRQQVLTPVLPNTWHSGRLCRNIKVWWCGHYTVMNEDVQTCTESVTTVNEWAESKRVRNPINTTTITIIHFINLWPSGLKEMRHFHV